MKELLIRKYLCQSIRN